MTKTSKIPKRPRQPVFDQLSQPLPFMNVAFDELFGSSPSVRNSASGGVHGAPHFLQTLRTSRCAINARVDDATRNGLTPMSIKRVTALGASFVCSVEKTK